jgi:hypothetical protein
MMMLRTLERSRLRLFFSSHRRRRRRRCRRRAGHRKLGDCQIFLNAEESSDEFLLHFFSFCWLACFFRFLAQEEEEGDERSKNADAVTPLLLLYAQRLATLD